MHTRQFVSQGYHLIIYTDNFSYPRKLQWKLSAPLSYTKCWYVVVFAGPVCNIIS